MNTNHHVRMGLIAAGIALLIPLVSTRAQEPTPGERVRVNMPFPVTPAPGNPSDPKQLITIDFPGGTLPAFIDAIRKAAAPTPVNVIVPSEAQSVQVSAVALQNVTVRNAIRAVRYTADSNFNVDAGPVSEDEGSEPIYAIMVDNVRATNSVNQARLLAERDAQAKAGEMGVFDIDALISAPSPLTDRDDLSLSPQNLLAAIELAAETSSVENAAKPEVLYHKDSNLVLVRGSDEQVRAVREVVGRLSMSLDRRRQEALESRKASDEARRSFTEMEIRLRQAQERLKQREMLVDGERAKHNRLLEMHMNGTISAEEVESAKIAASSAESSLRDAMLQLEEAGFRMEEAAAVREQLDTPAPAAESSPVIYDVRDLGARADGMTGVFEALTDPNGLPKVERQEGSFIVNGTIRQHAVIKACFDMLRAAKPEGKDGSR